MARLEPLSLDGFLNRWNDSLATPREGSVVVVAQDAIGDKGWTRGKQVQRPRLQPRPVASSDSSTGSLSARSSSRRR